MKNEFQEIIKDVLVEYSWDNDAQKIDLTKELSRDLLSEAIEGKIKEKFHIFRINRILTDNLPRPLETGTNSPQS
tara:strand:- start:35 stop:259 length:225 start_codon:yes stop_codon:yes gene_type:complete